VFLTRLLLDRGAAVAEQSSTLTTQPLPVDEEIVEMRESLAALAAAAIVVVCIPLVAA